MAYDVNAGGALVTIRSPWAPLGLGLLTLGLYGWVWYYKVNREAQQYGRARGDRELAASSPATSLLAVTVGARLIVPAFASLIGTTRRVQRVEHIAGRDPVSTGLMVALMLIPFAGLAVAPLLQRHLNGAWQQHLLGTSDRRRIVRGAEPPHAVR
jgi:hypothetical protein